MEFNGEDTMRNIMTGLKFLCFCLGITLFSATLSYGKNVTGIEVSPEVTHDVSPELRTMAVSKSKQTLKSTNRSSDQQWPQNKNNEINLRVFQGLGKDFPNYHITSAAPDANGSVGKLQYVQWVNNDILIIDKATGKAVNGFPKPGNSIWKNFGGLCEKRNLGHPFVKYDQLANRWVLTQLAYGDVFDGPFYQCIAVSKSEDAAGAYYRYAFKFDSYNDLGKLGLWPDAYYMTFKMKGPFTYGPRLCALDRLKMIKGKTGSMQCRQMSPDDSQVPLLPADLDGKIKPPINTPGYFVNWMRDYSHGEFLQIYKFHVDFKESINSKLIGPTLVYAKFFYDSSSAVQPNTTNSLNTHPESLMNRVVYRQFENYGSLIATQTVRGIHQYPPYFSAIRWQEIRFKGNSEPEMYQLSDYLPEDVNDRFLGSIGMDKSGNIAIGYNISSAKIYPSIELAFRSGSDPLNELTNIQTLVTGKGSQIDNVTDWGAYNSMSIDPVDDCTFWYTSEYLKETGTFNWSTAIISFKLPHCS